jgi:drug/metabolite transporter (DMT)-like permease
MLNSISHPKPILPIPIVFSVGIAAISFSAIFVKWTDAPTSVVAMYRLFVTVLLMLPFLFKYKQEFTQISKKVGLQLVGSGFFLGLHFLLWMASLRYTTVASSTSLLTLEPVFVMLGAFLVFRHKLRGMMVLGMLVAICGAIWMGWGDFRFSFEAFVGDALSLLSALAVAVHMLIGSNLRSSVSTYVYSISVFASAGIVIAIYNLAEGFSFVGYTMNDWTMFLLLAIVPTLLGHYVFNWLLKHVKPVSVSMSVLGEPLGATLLAVWLLGEKVTPSQIGAGCLLLLGVWLFIAGKEKRPL